MNGPGKFDDEDWQPGLTKEKPPTVTPYEWPQALDLEALAELEPEQPRSIMEGLPCGYATGIFGHGGVGKSAIALHLGVCVALGLPFFGLQTERRRVTYLSCEDRAAVLHWRLKRICTHLSVEMASLRGWLEIVDLVGHDAVLWDRDPRTGNTVTPAFGRLAQRITEYQTELLIVDGTSDTFAGNENARTDVKRFVNALVGLVPAERGAVLLIGHVDKNTARASETTEGYSGSTAWNNAVRARWYLRPETTSGEEGRTERTGGLILELQKANLGRADTEMRFEWDASAHLFLGQTLGSSAFDRKHQDRTEQNGILRALKGCAESGIYVPAAMTGPRTAFLVLQQRPEFPASLKGSGRSKSRRFWRQIENLRHAALCAESSIERKGRKYTATLSITTQGLNECA